jgi:hypothetical protein
MPALRPTDIAERAEPPPNIFAAARAAGAAPLADGDRAGRARGTVAAGFFGNAAAAPAVALPTLAVPQPRPGRRWRRPRRRLLVAATALMLGALGCAAVLNDLARTDRPEDDAGPNTQTSSPKPPTASSARQPGLGGSAPPPQRLTERSPRTSNGAPRHAKHARHARARRPARRQERATPPSAPTTPTMPPPAPAAPPASAPAEPSPRPPTSTPAPPPPTPAPQPLPVAPGSPPEFM